MFLPDLAEQDSLDLFFDISIPEMSGSPVFFQITGIISINLTVISKI
jgi:hypothetical protein